MGHFLPLFLLLLVFLGSHEVLGFCALLFHVLRLLSSFSSYLFFFALPDLLIIFTTFLFLLHYSTFSCVSSLLSLLSLLFDLFPSLLRCHFFFPFRHAILSNTFCMRQPSAFRYLLGLGVLFMLARSNRKSSNPVPTVPLLSLSISDQFLSCCLI